MKLVDRLIERIADRVVEKINAQKMLISGPLPPLLPLQAVATFSREQIRELSKAIRIDHDRLAHRRG